MGDAMAAVASYTLMRTSKIQHTLSSDFHIIYVLLSMLGYSLGPCLSFRKPHSWPYTGCWVEQQASEPSHPGASKLSLCFFFLHVRFLWQEWANPYFAFSYIYCVCMHACIHACMVVCLYACLYVCNEYQSMCGGQRTTSRVESVFFFYVSLGLIISSVLTAITSWAILFTLNHEYKAGTFCIIYSIDQWLCFHLWLKMISVIVVGSGY